MACHLFGGIIYRWSMGFSSQRSKNVKCVSISWRHHWMICRISTQFVVDNVWNWNHNFVWEVAWTYTRAATPAGWYAWRCGGPTVGGKPPGAVSLLHKRYHVSKTTVHSMGLLPDMQNCRLRMRRGMPGTFPPSTTSKEPPVSDPGMYHDTCVTHVPWCISGSLTRGGTEKVPGILGACATRNFAYLARGPWCVQMIGYIMALMSHSHVCTLHHIIIITMQKYLKALNTCSTCLLYFLGICLRKRVLYL